MDLDDLYQEIILEHYKQPKNQGSIDDPDVVVEGRNPFCGDQIKLTMRVRDGVIEDVKFAGSGCAISQASASIMTERIKGRRTEEVRSLLEEFSDMVKGGTHPHPHIDEDDEIAAFQGVSAFPTRVKCAMLAWNALKEAVERRLSSSSAEEKKDPRP